ncbi:acyl-CoA dehydrogenase family protein [Actinophytocola gossypii]|uniref:Acyl-CoA dehydrogenase family protein n=1 Tax=Actinophytocola gossypii TaxID=2812003 RepID=A0ABT2J3I0_9PSEU|nr:acyl-CoA dehydrogenase family protein [Actinophytocola gossypii]MCT2582251.1 acyl-CoA dehydrogenase family protein [Actinophytocola gossypii]
MRLRPTPEERQFADLAAEWLSRNVPREPRPPAGEPMAAFDRAWQRLQYDAGWAGVAWPKEYGGAGLSLVEQMIWFEQCARFDAPEPGVLNIALGHAGPVLIAEGTDTQRQDHLAAILRGDQVWAQGFSEPEAGSDLAALRTRGVVDGDHLVVDGTKIWTTGAHLSDWQELLVRTDPAAARHRGLSFAIVDLTTPGVEVRPITAMDGKVHFAQVFYDGVRIPLRNLVGGLGDGWKVAMTTLGFERGTMTLGTVIRLLKLIDDVKELARTRVDCRGQPLSTSDEVAARLADLEAEGVALHALAVAFVSEVKRTGSSSAGSMIRPLYAELSQRVKRTGAELLGRDGLTTDGTDEAARFVPAYLHSFGHTIGTGTAEVQRNVIAHRVLGLPRG